MLFRKRDNIAKLTPTERRQIYENVAANPRPTHQREPIANIVTTLISLYAIVFTTIAILDKINTPAGNQPAANCKSK